MRCAARLAPSFGAALSTLLLLAPAFAADPLEGCVPVARIVSIQGSVQLQRSGQTAWTVVRKLDTVVCQRDVLHAGPRSRAALLIDPETLVRLDQASTLAISQTPDETVVEFMKDPGLFARIVTAPNPCGAGYFISRFPRKFRVLTPFVNASVEGTEFLVAMRCESALVAVFEGRVRAQEVLAAASFSLSEGESVEAGIGQPAVVKLVVKPVDAVQWALYYPPLTEAAAEAADQKCDQADSAAHSVCIVQRAEQRLRSGRVEEAEADVQTLLNLGLGDGDAYALLSIIQVVKNDKATALDLANRATQLSPSSPRAWIALSYAHQAAFDLEKALGAATKAAELAPDSSTAQARVAELLMSVGRIREAEKAAKAAVAANSNDSRAHMVLGFVHLAQINTKAAREDFLNAIERDSTDPLTRLGLGLAIIRDGDLKAGREQIEIAVALDPTNSLIRSYVGKAYYEENTKERDQLAATQFGIAKRLDPKDPTPWFYDAILKQTQNRSVEAIGDLHKSIELNQNRAVYRSRLLLDEDQGATNANLARAYSDLKFDQLALTEAAKSLAVDPGSASAHQFLANVYATLPRHDIARESELLQSQLRQPLISSPNSLLKTREGLSSLLPNAAIPQALGMRRTGLNEFDSLFFRNGLSLFADALVATEDTFAEQLAVSVIHDRLSLSATQAYFTTDGFAENEDMKRDAYDVFAQIALTPQASVQAEYEYLSSVRGEVFSAFDPVFADPVRFEEDSTRFRVGGRYDVTPNSQVLLSAAHRTLEADLGFLLVDVDSLFDIEASAVEAQYVFSGTGIGLTGGAGYSDGSVHRETFFSGAFLLSDQFESSYSNGYLYGHFRVPAARMNVQLGLSKDNLDEGVLRRSELNPKLGLMWDPIPGTLVRAAWFQTLKRQFIGQQTIEPTQISGFNQFFDDPNATLSRRSAIQLDQRLLPGAYFGVGATRRELDVPLIIGTETQGFDWTERTETAYLYWTSKRGAAEARLAGWSVAASVEYLREHFTRPEEFTGNEGIVDLDTRFIGFGVTVLPANRLAVRLAPTYVRQRGRLQVAFFTEPVYVDDSEWVVDLSLLYRLPRRKGVIAVGASNLFDRELHFEETDPSNPRFAPHRLVFARLSLEF